MKPLFSADSIGKSFGRKVVLKSASVWAFPGRITALFGRNGCGKSTLLSIGVGTISADHGAVHYSGRTYLRPSLYRLAREGLFYLPQGGFLSPSLTLQQHLDAVWRCAGSSPYSEILELLELGELMHVRTRAYSGGERRRAELAIAVARRPKCLLADEPFTGISPATAELLAAVFRELASAGCAVIITGHEVPQMMQVADDVVWATAGTTHHMGNPSEAIHHEQFRREYLGPGRTPPPLATQLQARDAHPTS